MKLFPRKKLPPAPTGTEVLDLTWASYGPLCIHLLDECSQDVSLEWASAKGVVAFSALIQDLDAAKAELNRTPPTSALRPLRERRLRRLEAQTQECTLLILCALAAAARAAHRRATPGQIWVLIFDGFKTLVQDNRYELAELRL